MAIERQLQKDVLLRVAYAASKGTFLGYNVDLNAAVYGPGANTGDTQARRPNQNFQSIVEDIAGGNSPPEGMSGRRLAGGGVLLIEFINAPQPSAPRPAKRVKFGSGPTRPMTMASRLGE